MEASKRLSKSEIDDSPQKKAGNVAKSFLYSSALILSVIFLFTTIPFLSLYFPGKTGEAAFEELYYAFIINELSTNAKNKDMLAHEIMEYVFKQIRNIVPKGSNYPFKNIILLSTGECSAKAAAFVALGHRAGLEVGSITLRGYRDISTHSVAFYRNGGQEQILDLQYGWKYAIKKENRIHPASLNDLEAIGAFVLRENKLPSYFLCNECEKKISERNFLYFKSFCGRFAHRIFIGDIEYKGLRRIFYTIARANILIWGRNYPRIITRISSNRAAYLFSNTQIKSFFRKTLITARIHQLFMNYKQAMDLYNKYYIDSSRFSKLELEDNSTFLFWLLLMRLETQKELPSNLETYIQKEMTDKRDLRKKAINNLIRKGLANRISPEVINYECYDTVCEKGLDKQWKLLFDELRNDDKLAAIIPDLEKYISMKTKKQNDAYKILYVYYNKVRRGDFTPLLKPIKTDKHPIK